MSHVNDVEQWSAGAALIANDYGPVAAMLAAGGGVGALPEFLAAPYVDRGMLSRLEMASPIPDATFSLVWLRSRHLAPRIRAFIDLAVRHAQQTVWT